MLPRSFGALALLLFFQVLFAVDTGQTLRERYGPPISENFLVRPGVIVTATYGPSGRVCQLVVSPQRLWNSTMQPELVTEIVDELIPRTDRGKGGDAGLINAICPTNDCGGSQENWENVSITRYGGDSSPKIRYATIQWHRDECRPAK